MDGADLHQGRLLGDVGSGQLTPEVGLWKTRELRVHSPVQDDQDLETRTWPSNISLGTTETRVSPCRIRRPRTVACHKSAGTPGTSRCGGWPPPNTRLREPTHVKKNLQHHRFCCSSSAVGSISRRWSTRSSLRQSIRDCATKRCKSPPAGMPRNHDWNAALSQNGDHQVHQQRSVVRRMGDWCGFTQTHKHRRRKPERTEHKNTFGEHLLFSALANTNLPPTRQPTHHARRSRAVQGSKSVWMCVSSLFPTRLACASVYLRMGGEARERFRPTCPASKRHPYSNCAPSHMRVTRKEEEVVGGGGTFGYSTPWMTTVAPLRQD